MRAGRAGGRGQGAGGRGQGAGVGGSRRHSEDRATERRMSHDVGVISRDFARDCLLITLVVPINSRKTNKLYLLVSEKGPISGC